MDRKTIISIAIASTNGTIVGALKDILLKHEFIAEVMLTNSLDSTLKQVLNEKTNALIIDIFDLNTPDSVKLIENIRDRLPEVPICLLGTREQLHEMPNVPTSWKWRFLDHYYKLPYDTAADKFIQLANSMANKLASYWLSRKARVRLRDLQNIVAHDLSPNYVPHNGKTKEDVEKIVQMAIDALEVRELDTAPNQIVPGLESGDVQILVKQTIQKASAALEKTANINKTILACGAILVLGSFIIAILKPGWEPAVFGGFGIAGIITSLIVNPLRSIGKSAQRLVQIQVSYLSFLNQVSILNKVMRKESELSIKVSERLEAVTKSLQEALEKQSM
ncbi:MAG: hypothetical protein V3V99_14665 [candidate division Zixibacteria bacterium]